MTKINHSLTKKDRRRARVRGKLTGTATTPRLTVFRSNRHIYVQAIDDQKGRTLAAANDLSLTQEQLKKTTTKVDKAAVVAEIMAQALKTKKIKQVVFDRGHYRYHGRVKQVAETLRQAGIKF